MENPWENGDLSMFHAKDPPCFMGILTSMNYVYGPYFQVRKLCMSLPEGIIHQPF